MNALQAILSGQKPRALMRFLSLMQTKPSTPVPETPVEALAEGYREGVRRGYEAGLVDGLHLGLEVRDTMARFPGGCAVTWGWGGTAEMPTC